MPPAGEQTQMDKTFAGLQPAATVKSDKLDDMAKKIATYFQGHATKRAYVMTDKPLYQPGETIWFRADLRQTATLTAKGNLGINATLTSPRGAIVSQKRTLSTNGVAQNDF